MSTNEYFQSLVHCPLTHTFVVQEDYHEDSGQRSALAAWVWRLRPCDPLKHWILLTDWHGVTCQKTWNLWQHYCDNLQSHMNHQSFINFTSCDFKYLMAGHSYLVNSMWSIHVKNAKVLSVLKKKMTENQPVANERRFLLFVASMFFIVTGITSEVNWNSPLLSHA